MKKILFLVALLSYGFITSQEDKNYELELHELFKGVKYNQTTGDIINTEDYFKTINEVLSKIEMEEIIISVHTTSVGKQENNLRISEEVARKIKELLLKKGFNKNIIAIGKGENFPIVSTPTRAGRYLNRRVEVEVVK